MTDDMGGSLSFLGSPGQPVAEVDPDDVKTFWQKLRKLQAEFPGQTVGVSAGASAKTGPNVPAAGYRSSMLFALQQTAREQLSPWIKDEELSDAVFRTIATIPMEWIGHAVREGFPFEVEEFFRRLSETDSQGG